MNKTQWARQMRKHDRYSGGGDWLKGEGTLPGGGGGALRNPQMTENWESEIWFAVSARWLSRPALGGRFPDRRSNLMEAAGPGWAQAGPSRPPRRPRHGQSRPTGTGVSRSGSAGRPGALAVTRLGPALPPPPPRKSPLTPLPPSSAPSCRASETTELGAGG